MATFGPVIETPEAPVEEGDGIEVLLPEDDVEEEYEDMPAGFGANLAEAMDDDDARELAMEVIDNFDTDLRSRQEWAQAYANGLDLLGFKTEDRTQPWEGASGVFHPILTESIIRFQAQAIGELFPASGPARTKIVGKSDKNKREQAMRIEREMNYLLTERIEGYREETEQQLFHLPMAGSAFKKVYYDPVKGLPCSTFVPAEDVVVSYGATSLEGSERFTHIMRKTREEVEALMDVGFYLNKDLEDPSPWNSDVKEKYDELSGEEKVYGQDERFCLLEHHCTIMLEGDERPLPYVVTVDKSSSELLSVRRNWRESDPTKQARMHFVHYKYLPGLGFYGLGLIHLLGGLAKTATSLLRQLIDAGTLANLPAGLKMRGLRIKGDNTPFRPGEFRDVDTAGLAIKDSITFLPYKEPSNVLYQLLGDVTNEARRMGSVAETDLTNFNKEMPVGTAFAVLERQMKVMTGVQARLHASLKRELKLLAAIIHDYMDGKYEWDEEGEFDRKKDFDGRVDVIPVSDPNAATTAQKVVAYQAAMQMAQQAPQLYNMGRLHRQMLETLNVDNADEILKLPEDIKPMDPVTENMAILKQEPVRAFLHQDHEAHIKVHMAAAQDPKILQIVGQSSFAEAIQASMQAHITEHVAFEYRKQIEKQLGVPLPGPEENLPEDVEVEMSRAVAEAAEKLLGQNQAEMAALEAQAQEQDPLTQIQRKELELKEKKQDNDYQIELLKVELDAFKNGVNMAHQRERLNSEEMRAALQASIKLATEPKAADKVAMEQARIAVQRSNKMEKAGENSG